MEAMNMSKELIKRMPAILAAASTTRARTSGEITVDGMSIRQAAIDSGYTEPITKAELGAAMAAVGAVFHNAGPRGARYVFKGALHKSEVIDSAAAKVSRLGDQAGSK
ncbi:hypothetical protein [Paraburkholderia fungorum]|uniref:Uncharacterized protein n=1 Tax=Paraburkholderia fungorum TaxID=134537 RepID=A0AAW3V2Z5_9BURK|nr:hypothetical protein [Paraburkholderia fungorum]MBB4515844.1 hypothetical protein [Paraburkholderia fungorum]MBB6203740.1 hypothetical protein [Paraburkholderia fungorum]